MSTLFRPRRIDSSPEWHDEDGVKLYTVSASGRAVARSAYLVRLAEIKETIAIDWTTTPAFAIFHDGAHRLQYLVLAWWGNDNELLTSVSVREGERWVEDPRRYSFCLWDLEIFWAERAAFIDHLYCERPDLDAYRRARFAQTETTARA